MKLSNQVKPISYLKANAAKIIRNIGEQTDPLIITQNGEAKAIIQDIKSYEESKEMMAMLKVLALGNQQIEDGKTKPSSKVFSEIRNRAKD